MSFTYQYIDPDHTAIRRSDGLSFLIDPANRHYAKMVRDGAQPADYVAAADTIITYESFQDRFTAAEFNDATDFVYEADATTGKPKRKAMIQGLSRAIAKNTVDLEDARTVAFMDALVAGSVITSARKGEILTP